MRPGAWQIVYFGVPVACLTSGEHNRMRILSPITPLSQADPGAAQRMLEANFHTTLDARYGISDGNIYALFLHPLSTLTDRAVQSALLQVVSLVRTFGSDYSSGVLQYGGSGD